MNSLLRIGGFLAFISAVFLNAFVDLGHKIIIQNTLFKTFDGDAQILLTAIVNALILLPFILLFSPSGFLADRFTEPVYMGFEIPEGADRIAFNDRISVPPPRDDHLGKLPCLVISFGCRLV